MKTNILKQNIMRRVYFVYWVRRLTRPMALRAYGLAASAIVVSFMVSVRNIMSNMPEFYHLHDTTAFLFNAFRDTRHIIQFLVLAIIVVAVFLARDLLNNVSEKLQTSIQAQ
ncbi:hypothetical protein KW783_00780 [Candidatus Parcubacteria bacterium]|nr:hypothetical protein [Candidatus Parcubacteria bacterium]